MALQLRQLPRLYTAQLAGNMRIGFVSLHKQHRISINSDFWFPGSLNTSDMLL
jgi:hypothetical protein